MSNSAKSTGKEQNTEVQIPKNLIDFFAAEEDGEFFSLIKGLIENVNHSIYNILNGYLNSFSIKEVESYITNPKISFMFENRDMKQSYELARMNLAAERLKYRVAQHKIETLYKNKENERPNPYRHVDLQELHLDKHFMIKLTDLKMNDGKLIHGNSAFHILPSLPLNLNSMYWVLQNLFRINNEAAVLIRLDPFIVKPKDIYNEPFYKMDVYGKQLDWEDIANLKEERHVRWMPDDPNRSDILFSDAVWSPRDDGIHFICEELPSNNVLGIRGSRYFHAIYNPITEKFIHFDGAIRLYTKEELDIRQKEHVRNRKKIGKRIKIFQVDGQIDRRTWCNIAASFFVWNDDVQKYFSKGIF